MALSVIWAKSQIVLVPVDGVRQAGRDLAAFFLYQDHLFAHSAGFGFVVIVTACNGVTGFFENREDARSLFVVERSGCAFKKTTACVEIEISFWQV